MTEKISVREIVATFGIETDDAAAKKWANNVDNLKAGMAGAVNMAAKLASGVAALGAGFFALAKMTANSADENIKAARRLGMQTEAYQELKFAAGQSGLAGEQFIEMLAKQNTILGQAANKEQTATVALKNLGLEYKDLAALAPDQQFERIADSIIAIDNPSRRSAAAARIFGETWSRAASLIEGGSEGIRKLREQAQMLGFVVGEDAAKASEEFNDSIARLTLRAQGLRNRIGFALIPVFQKAIHTLEGWFDQNREIINQKMEIWAERLEKGVGKAFEVIEKAPGVIDKLGGLENILKTLATIVGTIATVHVAAPFVTLAGALIPVGKAIAAVGFVALGKVLLLITVAVVKITVVLGTLYYVITDIFAYLEGRDSVLGRIVNWLREWFERTQEAQGALGSFMRMLVAFGNLVRTIAGVAWSAISPVLTSIKELALDVFDSISNFFSGLFDSIVAPVFQALADGFAEVIETWLSRVTSVFDFLTFAFENAEMIIKNFGAVGDAVFAGLVGRLTGIFDKVAEVGDRIKSLPGASLLGDFVGNRFEDFAANVPRVGSSTSNSYTFAGGSTVIEVNGAANPQVTAKVIDQKSKARDNEMLRAAKSAFGGGER